MATDSSSSRYCGDSGGDDGGDGKGASDHAGGNGDVSGGDGDVGDGGGVNSASILIARCSGIFRHARSSHLLSPKRPHLGDFHYIP